MPKVSVIVPVYKTEAYLPRCIDSLLSQQMQDLEIILVDDGSPDNCGAICDAYAQKHPNIKVIHQSNSGPLVARRTGLKQAQGEYIAFVDSDDWVEQHMYKQMLDRAQSEDADMVAVGFTRDFGSHTESYQNRIASGVYRGEALTQMWEQAIFDIQAMDQALAPCLWAKLFRRQAMQPIILNCQDPISFGEDAIVLFACLFAAQCVVVDNHNCAYRYQLREGSTTNSYYKHYMRDMFVVYDRMNQYAQPVCTDKITAAIAYNYIFLLQGCVAQELSRSNPASICQRYRTLRRLAKDQRLRQALAVVDHNRYNKAALRELKLLAKGRAVCFILTVSARKLKGKLFG